MFKLSTKHGSIDDCYFKISPATSRLMLVSDSEGPICMVGSTRIIDPKADTVVLEIKNQSESKELLIELVRLGLIVPFNDTRYRFNLKRAMSL